MNRSWLVLPVLLWAAPLPEVLLADSWAPRRASDALSENGRFICRVKHRSRRKQPASINVSSTSNNAPVWTTDLTSMVPPLRILVSNDGEHVVTLDDWHGHAYGNESIGFYGRAGLIARYSYTEVLRRLGKIRRGALSLRSLGSLHERKHSMIFLDGEGPSSKLCIWIDWANEWFAWRVTTGAEVSATPLDVQRWVERGRTWARDHLELASPYDRLALEGSNPWFHEASRYLVPDRGTYIDRVTACRFLAWTRDPRDREVLQHIIDRRMVSTKSNVETRRNADRALAILDGKAEEFDFTSERTSSSASGRDPPPIAGDDYYRLADLELQVELPPRPDPSPEEKSQLFVVLSQRSRDGPDGEHERRPSRLQERRFKYLAVVKDGKPIDVRKFEGIQPGIYRVRVMWDRKPFKLGLSDIMKRKSWIISTTEPWVVGTEDFESLGAETIHVKAGDTMTVSIECTLPGYWRAVVRPAAVGTVLVALALLLALVARRSMVAASRHE